jgi:hypothetical protein
VVPVEQKHSAGPKVVIILHVHGDEGQERLTPTAQKWQTLFCLAHYLRDGTAKARDNQPVCFANGLDHIDEELRTEQEQVAAIHEVGYTVYALVDGLVACARFRFCRVYHSKKIYRRLFRKFSHGFSTALSK